MSTLTEMIRSALKRELDPVQADWNTPIIKKVFKDWLKTVGLPDYDTIGKGGTIFSATDSLRKLLILLVDEP